MSAPRWLWRLEESTVRQGALMALLATLRAAAVVLALAFHDLRRIFHQIEVLRTGRTAETI